MIACIIFHEMNNVVVAFRTPCLHMVGGVVCVDLSHLQIMKNWKHHVDLAWLVWGPTLLNTHTLLPPKAIPPPLSFSPFFVSISLPLSSFFFFSSFCFSFFLPPPLLPFFSSFFFPALFLMWVFCVCIFVCMCVRIWPLLLYPYGDNSKIKAWPNHSVSANDNVKHIKN